MDKIGRDENEKTYPTRAYHISEIDIHPIITIYQMPIICITILQLDKHRTSLRRTKQGQRKLRWKKITTIRQILSLSQKKKK